MVQIELRHNSFENEMPKIASNSVDAILCDPPYKYLKNQKLETDFDEVFWVSECKRVLKKDGMLVFFGWGRAFHRWCYLFGEAGFIHKEDMVWEKTRNSSPVLPLSRVHESFAIFGLGKSKILRSKVPYLQMKKFAPESIVQDVKRLISALGNTKSLANLKAYLENNRVEFDQNNKVASKSVTVKSGSLANYDRNVRFIKAIEEGSVEKSIIRTDLQNDSTMTRHHATTGCKVQAMDKNVATLQMIEQGANEKSIIRTDLQMIKTKHHTTCNSNDLIAVERNVATLQMIEAGLNEKSLIRTDEVSIMKVARQHYKTLVPTPKPVELMERILKLVSKKDDLILDMFAGSAPVGIACQNLQRNYLGIEIDKEYHAIGLAELNENNNEGLF